MAFNTLQENLSKVFRNIQGKGKLSERNMEDTLKEIRIALLEADVNYVVVKTFLDKVRLESKGQDVLNAVEPGQLLVKIVHDEIVRLLSDEDNSIKFKDKGLTIIMLVGLQGTGKTTQSAKIANLFKKQGRNPLLVAADIKRPAAIEQLKTLGNQIAVEVYSEGNQVDVISQIKNAISYASSNSFDTLLIDTAGRLQIDQELMDELVAIKDNFNPDEILLTVDALTGQDIANVAKGFNEALDITGLIVTKFDGDSKGGAILSVKAITGVPIKFTGVGEKIEDLEIFYPERVAQRILGMGDVVSLVEKAQEQMDMEKAQRAAERMMAGKFTMDDLLVSIEQSAKLGSVSAIMSMIPGLSNMASQIDDNDASKHIKTVKAIIQSMTPDERDNPLNMRSSHKRRIAKGSGTSIDEVNKLINQYEKMKKIFKSPSLLRNIFGG